jgi:hypothetical protein
MVLELRGDARPHDRGVHRRRPDDFREVVLTPPSDLFEEEATLDLGGPPRRAAPPRARPHDNDIVITVRTHRSSSQATPRERGGPAFGDSYPIAWADTGRTMLSLIDGAVVPGHGDPFDIGLRRTAGRRAGRAGRLGTSVVKADIGEG